MNPINHELIYLASPYSKYPSSLERAFKDTCAIAAKLISQGYRVYSPIAHTHPIAMHGGLDPYDHSIWLPFDRAIMDRCDAMMIAMMDSWKQSYGIAEEIKVFTAAGKPIYYLNPHDMKVVSA